MRRVSSILLLTLLLCCAIPSSGQAANGVQRRFHVVTTFTIIQDIAQNIAGDAAIVDSITKPGAEIHGYQPTPGDIIKTQKADMVLWNGLNLEKWFEKFFENVQDVPQIVVSEGVIPSNIGGGTTAGKPNPHAWMSPSNALIYVENIRKAFVLHDPDHADTYNRNAKAYSNKIRALDAPIRQRLSAIPENKRWLLSSEGAFSYLAHDYDLKEAYLWPINADQQGTPQQIRRVIDLIRKNAIPVIFSESTVSNRPAKQVAKETGIHYGGVLYVDSLSEPDGPVPTYLDLLRVSVETIATGLEK